MLLNELVLKRPEAGAGLARYLGVCEVGTKEEGPLYAGQLSAGLWLVFAFEVRIPAGQYS